MAYEDGKYTWNREGHTGVCVVIFGRSNCGLTRLFQVTMWLSGLGHALLKVTEGPESDASLLKACVTFATDTWFSGLSHNTN